MWENCSFGSFAINIPSDLLMLLMKFSDVCSFAFWHKKIRIFRRKYQELSDK